MGMKVTTDIGRRNILPSDIGFEKLQRMAEVLSPKKSRRSGAKKDEESSKPVSLAKVSFGRK